MPDKNIFLLNQLYVPKTNKYINVPTSKSKQNRSQGAHMNKSKTLKWYKTEWKALVISVSDIQYVKTSIFWFCVVWIKYFKEWLTPVVITTAIGATIMLIPSILWSLHNS